MQLLLRHVHHRMDNWGKCEGSHRPEIYRLQRWVPGLPRLVLEQVHSRHRKRVANWRQPIEAVLARQALIANERQDCVDEHYRRSGIRGNPGDSLQRDTERRAGDVAAWPKPKPPNS